MKCNNVHVSIYRTQLALNVATCNMLIPDFNSFFGCADSWDASQPKDFYGCADSSWDNSKKQIGCTVVGIWDTSQLKDFLNALTVVGTRPNSKKQIGCTVVGTWDTSQLKDF